MHKALCIVLALFVAPLGATSPHGSLKKSRSTCAPPPATYGYRFLDPRVLEYDSQLYPFYAVFAEAFDVDPTSSAELRRSANVDEWHARFCEQATREDIEGLLYGPTLGRLQEVLRLQGDKKARGADLGPTLRQNSFAAHLVEKQCTEVVEYLVYAKEVEPYVTSRGNGFERPARDAEAMKTLLDDARRRFTGIKSHYVRLRYAYQMIRLAHYLGEYAYALELYEFLLPKIDAEASIVYDWITGHRAGVLQALGEYPESAYLFSRLFDRCVSCRESALRSFRVRTDAEWSATQLLAANDHERAMLYVLRAQDRRALIVEEMENIYALDPNSRALEPLLMRELIELERGLLGRAFNPDLPGTAAERRRRDALTKRLLRLQTFVNRVVDGDQAAKPELWLLARGTLEMLAGQYGYARESFTNLQDQFLDDSLRQQARILVEVTKLLALDRITDSLEMYYYDLLSNDALRARYPDLRRFVNDKMEDVYQKRGQPGKAALMRYGYDAIQKNPQRRYITELLTMGDSLTGNAFDRLLLETRIGDNARDDIQHLLGVYYLQAGQWETALEAFTEVTPSRMDRYGTYAPFVKQFHDRVNYRPSAADAIYNKQTLLSRLLELEDDARRTENDTAAARNYFNIGLAHYNMSYFSYNWRVADLFRSGASAARAARGLNRDAVFSHPEAPLGNRENFGMDRARYYFERSLSRAPTREIAAEALYYLAKTERNEYYATGRPGGSRPFNYFRQLHEGYADTRYHDYVIAECKTFAWFVGQQ